MHQNFETAPCTPRVGFVARKSWNEGRNLKYPATPERNGAKTGGTATFDGSIIHFLSKIRKPPVVWKSLLQIQISELKDYTQANRCSVQMMIFHPKKPWKNWNYIDRHLEVPIIVNLKLPYFDHTAFRQNKAIELQGLAILKKQLQSPNSWWWKKIVFWGRFITTKISMFHHVCRDKRHTGQQQGPFGSWFCFTHRAILKNQHGIQKMMLHFLPLVPCLGSMWIFPCNEKKTSSPTLFVCSRVPTGHRCPHHVGLTVTLEGDPILFVMVQFSVQQLTALRWASSMGFFSTCMNFHWQQWRRNKGPTPLFWVICGQVVNLGNIGQGLLGAYLLGLIFELLWHHWHWISVKILDNFQK